MPFEKANGTQQYAILNRPSVVPHFPSMMMYNNYQQELESLAQWCGNLAPWASVIVFLAPLPTIRKIVTVDQSVGNLPLLPYSAMICSALLWSTYGILRSEPRIWSANMLGLILGLYYFLRFIQFSPKASPTLPGSVTRHVQFIAIVTVATIGLATTMTDVVQAASIIGMAGVLFAFAMFASPLSVLKHVLETGSAKAIPLPFTLASFFNCALWSVFGIFGIHDVNVYLPNVLGLLCSIAQIALKIKYGDNGQQQLRKTTKSIEPV